MKKDQVIPFLLKKSNIKGTIVRLEGLLKELFSQGHAYPNIVGSLISDAVTLTTLLTSRIKFDGLFTLQLQSNNVIKYIVVDVTSEGDVRAYAKYDTPKVINATEQHDFNKVKDKLKYLMNEGYMFFTVAQKNFHERYQGVVKLSEENIEKTANDYFRISEQIKSSTHLFNNFDNSIKLLNPEKAIAGGLIIQKLPVTNMATEEQKKYDEDWQRVQILASTLTNSEILDQNLDLTELLYRLFHEEEIIIYEGKDYHYSCRCNRKKVADMLSRFDPEEIEKLGEDGKVLINCDFCGKGYEFNTTEIERPCKSLIH